MFQIECSNGQIGFGRRRRAIDVSSTDKNKLFEVTMSALIKVDFEEDAVIDKGRISTFFRKFNLFNLEILLVDLQHCPNCT